MKLLTVMFIPKKRTAINNTQKRQQQPSAEDSEDDDMSFGPQQKKAQWKVVPHVRSPKEGTKVSLPKRSRHLAEKETIPKALNLMYLL
jgi:hypothetical protein